ncbi:23687_t:CDS:1 [Dentiscutata erythropus]|uniref:23687_t:CDS:1 n=1 Tax=Dentiscutata erythropus TaxID=1348616 RepID=A0A9N9GHG7_9GLOM|nr:23687_t:CDS:1 [Dentiscutata erythropus]
MPKYKNASVSIFESAFECNPSNYYNQASETTIISQISSFGSVAGLIFIITFYGVSSKLNFKTTCIVDDLLILTFLLTPIFSWFFSAKLALIFFNASVIVCLSLFVLSFLIVLWFVSGLVYSFHFMKNELVNYNWVRHSIVWICFAHSILVMIFDLKHIYKETKEFPTLIIINLEGLNLFTDLIHFTLASWMFISYYFLPKPKFKIGKKLFFFVIFLSITQCFFEFSFYCTPKDGDTFFFFILTTVLTRSISSFFSNSKEIRVKDIEKVGMKKFVFLQIDKQISNYLGHQRLYVEVDSENLDAIEYVKNVKSFYENKEYEKVRSFYKKLIEQSGGEDEKYLMSIEQSGSGNEENSITEQSSSGNEENSITEQSSSGNERSKQSSSENLIIEQSSSENLIIEQSSSGNEQSKQSSSGNEQSKQSSSGNENGKNKKYKCSIVKNIISESFKKPVNKRFIMKKIDRIEKNPMKIPGTKIIAEGLINYARIYANILETGLFQYITYSHRSNKNINDKKNEMIEIIIENDNRKEILKIKKSKAKWFVIPRFMESKDMLDKEFKLCKNLEDKLNIEH